VNRVLFRKLLRDLFRRKGSLAALLIIVAIGTGCYVGMESVYRDLDGARERYYRNQRLADFTVDLKRAPAWAVDSLADLPGVKAVRGRVNFGVRIDLAGTNEPISGTAISLPQRRRPVLDDVLLRSGTWFSDDNEKEVILNDAFADAHGLRPGDRIRVLLLDREHDLLIVGTAMSPEFVYLIPESGGLAPDPARFGVLYLQEDFLRRACGLEGAWNQVIGWASDTRHTAVDNLLTEIQDRLDPYGVTNTTPARDQASVRFLADELLGIKTSARVIPVIFLSVAALVLNILMSRLVAQQRTVIGTLRALGYSAAAIRAHYLTYGVIIGLAGGFFGNLVGYWLQSTLCRVYVGFFALPSIAPHFYSDLVVFGFLISVVFSVLGILRGTRSAARLEPAEAMRPPPPEKGGAVLPSRLQFLWRPLSFRMKMMLRTIGRNPFRSGVSIFASLVSTALILATLSNIDSLDYLMRYEYQRMAHQDFTVALRDPRGVKATHELGRMPGVTWVEPQLLVVCDLVHGPREKRIGVTGLPEDSLLYTPLDGTGQPIAVPDTGLVLSRKLAEVLDAAPGDRISLRPLIGRRERVEADVVSIVDTYLGLSAYAGRAYLSRLIGETPVGNALLGKSFTQDVSIPLLHELKRRPTVLGTAQRRRSFIQLEETFGETMSTSLSVMILFAGLIAFGSVVNTALVSLSERNREVGTLRVLGYTPGQVAGIFSGESFLLNGIGLTIGLAVGVGLAHLVSSAYSTELYRFPAVIHPVRFLHTALIVTAFVAVAQGILYWLIQKLHWLEVLKVKE